MEKIAFHFTFIDGQIVWKWFNAFKELKSYRLTLFRCDAISMYKQQFASHTRDKISYETCFKTKKRIIFMFYHFENLWLYYARTHSNINSRIKRGFLLYSLRTFYSFFYSNDEEEGDLKSAT